MRKGQNKKRQKNGIFVVLLIMDLLSIYEVLYLLPRVHYFLHPKVYSLFSFLIPTEKWTWNLPWPHPKPITSWIRPQRLLQKVTLSYIYQLLSLCTFFFFLLKKMVEMHSSETTHKFLIKPTYSAQRTEPKDVFSLSFLGVFFQLFLQASIQLESALYGCWCLNHLPIVAFLVLIGCDSDWKFVMMDLHSFYTSTSKYEESMDMNKGIGYLVWHPYQLAQYCPK